MINVLDLFRRNRAEPSSQLEPVSINPDSSLSESGLSGAPEAVEERIAVCQSCSYAVRLTRRQARPLCPFCAERTALLPFEDLNASAELAGRPREEIYG